MQSTSPLVKTCAVLLCLTAVLMSSSARSLSHDPPRKPKAAATQYYVSASGSDSASGDAEHPFKTITRAQQAVQALKKAHGGQVPAPGVLVNVATGSYDFSDAPLQLTSADSGSADAWVTYQGVAGVVLSGGIDIPTAAWEHHKTVPANPDSIVRAVKPGRFNRKDYRHHHQDNNDARSSLEEPLEANADVGEVWQHVVKREASVPMINIMKVDLRKLNITNYGDLASGSLGDCANNKLEAFYAGKPLVLARHPNIGSDGKPQFLNIFKVLNTNTEFQFSDSVLAGLKDYKSLWLHGYWGQDWADNYVRVKQIDGSLSTVTTDPSTPPIYGYHNKARFYALNVLEFLDSPGEYYLDRDTGILYFALPADTPEDDTLTVSMAPTVISLNNVSFMTLDGFDVMYSRELALTGQTTSYVTVSNGEFSCHGGRAVRMSGASNTHVHNITAHALGCGGISVEGGDLHSLTRGQSMVRQCSVFDFARWKRTYNPAIAFGGVGNDYLSNTISGGPHAAMLGSCNDCLFAYNNISNMCFESTDTGAFYTGRSWIRRGNVMHNNVFTHIRTTEHTVLGSPSVQAIYLDDQMSGFEIFNNTFIDCQKGTFVGGGRRNLIYNNYYEDCDDAVHLDARGLNWQKTSCQKNGSFYQEMESVHYDQPPWSTRYPELLTIFSEHPCYPAFTSYTNNTYCKCKHFADVSDSQMKSWNASMSNNVEKCR